MHKSACKEWSSRGGAKYAQRVSGFKLQDRSSSAKIFFSFFHLTLVETLALTPLVSADQRERKDVEHMFLNVRVCVRVRTTAFSERRQIGQQTEPLELVSRNQFAHGMHP